MGVAKTIIIKLMSKKGKEMETRETEVLAVLGEEPGRKHLENWLWVLG